MTALDSGFDAAFVPQVRDDLLVAAIGNEAMAWAPSAPVPTMLDQVNYIVFQLVDGDGSVGDLVADVHEVIGIPESMAEARIQAALATLHMGGLLANSPGAADETKPPTLTGVDVVDPNFLLGPPNN